MIELLLTVALIGLVAYAIVHLVPMPAPVQTVVIVTATLFAVLLVLRAFGLDVPVTRLR